MPFQSQVSPQDERTWGLWAHLGGILTGFILPLIVYLNYKDKSLFLRRHGAQALNFQLTYLIAYVVGAITAVVFVGIFIILAAAVLAIVFGIQGAMAANRGQDYRYPITIQFIKT